MRRSVASLLVLGSAGVCRAQPINLNAANKSALVQLTATNFDQLVTNGSTWLVMLYAPWCGHCTRMMPEVERLATYVRSSPPPSDTAAFG